MNIMMSSHALHRVAERDIPIQLVQDVVSRTHMMLGEKEIRLKCGGLTVVAKRLNEEPFVITVWHNE